MLVQSSGIVLHRTNYSETSIITKIFTAELGTRTYIVKGVRSARSKKNANLFQPLSLLDMVVYERPDKDLHHLKEFRHKKLHLNISGNIVKSSLSMFIAELLTKALRTHEADKELFTYLEKVIEKLDQEESSVKYFHLYFIAQLCGYLGFEPFGYKDNATNYFDLNDGVFSSRPNQINSIGPPISDLLKKLFAGTDIGKQNSSTREELLASLLKYLQYHIDGFGIIRSTQVLKSVLH